MKNWMIYGLVLLYLLIMVAVSVLSPKELNWRDSFSRTEKLPYGCSVLFENLPTLFPKSDIYLSTKSMYEELVDSSLSDHTIFLIDRDVDLDYYSWVELMEYVESGEECFISSQNISGQLHTILDSLSITYDRWSNLTLDSVDRARWSPFRSLNAPDYSLNQIIVRDDTLGPFPINYQWNYAAFDLTYASDSVEVLGMSQDTFPNYIRFPYGKGRFYIHLQPEAFTNYHILRDDSRDYSAHALSYLSDSDIFWDGYTESSLQESGSRLRVILSDPNLKVAWYLIIFGLIMYVLSFIKREQKMIPILRPYSNASLDYTRTIGSTYFEYGRPGLILNKRVQYLRDLLSRKYYIRDVKFTEAEAEAIHIKTGYDEDSILRLFSILRNLEARHSISDGQLLAATKNINKFYRHIE